MALKYGSKDLMRIKDIHSRSGGDWSKAMMLAKQMSDLISQPGKAQARGYAAQAHFGNLSPLAYIFFERAYELGGDNVHAEASINPMEDEGAAFDGIPDDELPASCRSSLQNSKPKSTKYAKPTQISSMGRVNLAKGTGPEFSIHDFNMGILEVWKDPNTVNPKLLWSVANEPNYSIGEEHDFIYDVKRTKWSIIDYIDTIHIANLIPLYGKNLMIYSYS